MTDGVDWNGYNICYYVENNIFILNLIVTLHHAYTLFHGNDTLVRHIGEGLSIMPITCRNLASLAELSIDSHGHHLGSSRIPELD